MIKINLVPGEILSKDAQKQQTIQIAMVGGALGILIVGVSALHYWKSVKLKKELEVAHEELKRLEEVVKKVQEAEAKALAVRQRLKVIDDLLKERALYPYFMTDLAATVPLGIWVKALKTDTNPNKSLKLSMTLEANTSEDIVLWYGNMEKNGKFSMMEMGAVGVSGERSLTFPLTAVYTPNFNPKP